MIAIDWRRRVPQLALLAAVTFPCLPLLRQLWAWVATGEMHYWLLYDDAYYYARMALGWYHGEGFSFNGVEQTNGFQPLWMLLSAFLACLALGSLKPFFVIYVAAVALINVATICWFHRLYRDQLGAVAAWLVPLFLMASCQQIFGWGMETLLAMPALYYLVARLLDAHWAPRQYWLAGSALAWLFLVRLDSLVLLPLLGLWSLRRYQAHLTDLLALALPVLLTAACYFLLNQYWYGSPVPVSGLAKSLGAPHFANFSSYGYLYYLLTNLKTAWLLLLWLFSEMAYGRQLRNAPGRYIVWLFLAAVLMQFGYYATLSGWGVWPWYGYLVVPLLLTVILRISSLIHLWEVWSVRGARQVLGLIMLAAMTLVVARQGILLMSDPGRHGSFAERNYRDAKASVFSHKTIIMGDRAGGLGFWDPTVKIAQTEGLVMSKGFIDSRARGQGNAWVDAHYRVKELVVDRPWLPTMNHGADKVYLVVEPIQAMIWQDAPLVYCFPEFAVLSEEHGDDFVRLRFDYDERMICPEPLMSWLNDVNRRGQLYQLTFNLRPTGVQRILRNIDHAMAAMAPPPRPIVQDVAAPE